MNGYYNLKTLVNKIMSNERPLKITGNRCWIRLVLAALATPGSTYTTSLDFKK